MNDEGRLKTWTIYQSAWGPVDEHERRRLLGESVTDGILYTDPASQTNGLEELITRIGHSQRMYPGAYFKNDRFIEHHDQGLFQWTMYNNNGLEFVNGFSFGRFDKDGRLMQATGFFEAPSSKA